MISQSMRSPHAAPSRHYASGRGSDEGTTLVSNAAKVRARRVVLVPPRSGLSWRPQTNVVVLGTAADAALATEEERSAVLYVTMRHDGL